MRHDVDVDLGAAVAMAETERELGVAATYFVMLRSPVYNVLSRANHRLVQRIVELGHAIGLHYDQGFEPDDRPLAELVAHEVDVLEQAFRIEIRAVSFHQPGPAVLDNEVDVSPLVNTYDRDDMRGFTYISDSNMLWRGDPAHAIFEQALHPRLHLLIHPLWWAAELPGESTAGAFDRALLANWRRAQEQMLATERAYGPARRFEILSP
jgi:peptidoglycan/xylan/chitin deacetylase (PgdA/CDA1 family)